MPKPCGFRPSRRTRTAVENAAFRRRHPERPFDTRTTVRAPAALLDAQTRWADQANLPSVAGAISKLRHRLEELRATGSSALSSQGWGNGLTGKLGLANPTLPTVRKLLQSIGVFAAETRTGLPLPKTPKIVFLQG